MKEKLIEKLRDARDFSIPLALIFLPLAGGYYIGHSEGWSDQVSAAVGVVAVAVVYGAYEWFRGLGVR